MDAKLFINDETLEKKEDEMRKLKMRKKHRNIKKKKQE